MSFLKVCNTMSQLKTLCLALILSISFVFFGAGQARAAHWTLFYDWGCTNIYEQANMNIEDDGTWTMNNDRYEGQWFQGAGIFVFQFNGVDVTYAGNRAGQAIIAGIARSNTAPNSACFYMLRSGGLRSNNSLPVGRRLDPAGKRI